ncbi:hypothetical protein [Pelagibacterium halotolerans]|uniref:AbiTii domain-containing protein n=1 Tax=Pelagibacterium halotolerans TaxID=531813 RepID=UPI0005A28587|nr:hypothetical protein [Pelagibacterium halotolerans]QJR20359.1 hypothetical protein HKM20_19070 [Pelagibacterium halotolerans]SEA59737.1 hypothetical protein SAMN05428936_105129 [Pelagibacterium halotolerans]
MGILGEIQAAVLNEKADLASVLLRLRFLASRLGSEPLEDWVKYETEGYPKDVEVPEYRKLSVQYRGTWSGPWASGIENAPIPSYLIEKHAGESWTEFQMRESVAAVDDLTAKTEGSIGVDASNLILILQGKVYPDLACNSITGELSLVAVREIKQTVRSRVLELTLELEKRLPEAADVTLDQRMPAGSSSEQTVTEIFRQTVYGGVRTNRPGGT